MPRPRGGDWLEDEVRAWKQAGVDGVVSLLTNDEIAHFDLAQEAELTTANGLTFWSKPVVDRGIPRSKEDIAELASALATFLERGQNIAIHCRQGVGRSALIAVAVLVTMGMDVEEAIERVAAARGCPVPETPEQRQWLLDFARTAVRRVPR